MLCPETLFRFPSLLKCLKLPPSRAANLKESSQSISNKRNTASRSALVAISIFDCLVTLQDKAVFIANLDRLVQTLDLFWGTSDVTIINSLQSLISKIVQIIPPPQMTDLGILASVTIHQEHSPVEVFWIRIAQVSSHFIFF